MKTSEFYGYRVRSTVEDDWRLAKAWSPEGSAYHFWLLQGFGRESFLVSAGEELIAFFQVEHRWMTQARLHFQSSPHASRKKILRGITKLVPLIEKALVLRGVRAIFFTSHSVAMSNFMEGMGYHPAGSGGEDGLIMAKRFPATETPSV